MKRSTEDPFLHPARAARVWVRCGDEELAAGWLGELHPAVAARWAAVGKRFGLAAAIE